MSILEDYSGIIVNQNAVPGPVDKYPLNSTQIFQEFFLPSDIVRGTGSDERRAPDLSGFQIAVSAPSHHQAAGFDWVLEYQIFGVGWLTLDKGTAVGAHTWGNKVWMNVYLNQPVPIDAGFQGSRFHIGITGRDASLSSTYRQVVPYDGKRAVVNGNAVDVTLTPDKPYPFILGGVPSVLVYESASQQAFYSVQQGPTHIWYTTPNPLAASTASARTSDGFTALGNFSFNFRVLALSADDGTDFLGNRYRSVAVAQDAANVNTRDGAVTDKYWLSKPNPSRFAVESLYFDVRQPAPATYGFRNLVLSPSFEVGIQNWVSGGTAPTVFAAQTGWSKIGSSALRITSGALGSGAITYAQSVATGIVPGRTYTLRYTRNTLAQTGTSSVYSTIDWLTNADVVISSTTQDLSTGLGITEDSYTAVAPPTATKARIRIGATGGGTSGTSDFYIDAVLFGEGNIDHYFDGTMPGYIWGDQAYNSVSVQVTSPSTLDERAVIDRVLLDPLTPGMYFHVYYSDEGDPGTTPEEWDNKLWHTTPKTFRSTKREVHTLPEPVKAKYIKVEFTHLQAKHYAPGDFAKPITYRKHPRWVLDYFLARVTSDQLAADKQLGIKRVGVVFDAIDIAYNYYLDDLAQEPNQPINVSETTVVPAGPFQDQVDQVTLDQINLVMKPYRENPSVFAKNSYILSNQAQSITSSYPVESAVTPIAQAEIRSLRNQEVQFENDYPVMFFFVTCRHGYRELTATFSHDRAYFAGVNEIAFTRERYTQAHDNTQYIEPGADILNIERNDFVSDGGSMIVTRNDLGGVIVGGVALPE